MKRRQNQQIASLGNSGFFKIFEAARGMDKSHRLGTKTMDDQVKHYHDDVRVQFGNSEIREREIF